MSNMATDHPEVSSWLRAPVAIPQPAATSHARADSVNNQLPGHFRGVHKINANLDVAELAPQAVHFTQTPARSTTGQIANTTAKEEMQL